MASENQQKSSFIEVQVKIYIQKPNTKTQGWRKRYQKQKQLFFYENENTLEEMVNKSRNHHQKRKVQMG